MASATGCEIPHYLSRKVVHWFVFWKYHASLIEENLSEGYEYAITIIKVTFYGENSVIIDRWVEATFQYFKGYILLWDDHDTKKSTKRRYQSIWI